MRAHLQHWLNGLHVYCRLCTFLCPKRAMDITRRWESTTVYRRLYA